MMILPKFFYRRFLILLLATAGLAALSNRAFAADVDAALSARETYVGLPVTLQIRIVNAEHHEAPRIPDVDGLSISSLGPAGRSRRISIINGRRSETSTITYAYELTPQRAGKFVIPSIDVEVDGKTLHTREATIVASRSETGDLLFVEVTGARDQIYVGEPLELTLKIWIRPYQDKKLGLTLNEGQTWQLLSDKSSWGMFTDRLQELANENKRPAGEEVLREDRAGDPRRYYLYQIQTTVYPQRPGAIDGENLQVIVNYPTALGKSRSLIDEVFGDRGFPFGTPSAMDDDFASPFASRLRVTSYRPLVAATQVAPIRVKAIPTAGRPADYRGAVGQYKILTEASPTHVKAGDPITLRIGIVGTGRMDLVQAPPLEELEPLTRDFKVPDEPLAGLVEDQKHTKLFTTSIRPRQANIKQVPSIPFSYFDPAAEKFVTVNSRPISLEVEPADTLAWDAIVSNQAPKSRAATSPLPADAKSTQLSDSFQNYTSADSLLDQQPAGALTLPMWLWLVTPPVLVLAIPLIQYGRQFQQLGGLWTAPHRMCVRSIQAAEHPAEVSRALQHYFQRKFRLSGEPDSAMALGSLRTAGHGELAVRAERIFTKCRRCDSIPGGLDADALERLKSDALQLVADVHTLPAKPGMRLSVAPRRTWLWLAICGGLFGMNHAWASEPLTADQLRTVFEEANQAYLQACERTEPDAADTKKLFGTAADKYQLLVDTGVRHSQLYFNLANACQLSGQTGRAIANYYRALRLDPTNARCRKNLQVALRSAGTGAEDAITASPMTASWLARVHDGLTAFVHPTWIWRLFVVGWVGFWAAVGFRLLPPGLRAISLPWRTLAVLCILVCAVAGTSFALSLQHYTSCDLAVVVKPVVSLKESDGSQFATVLEWKQAEGRPVQVLQSRGRWLKIQTRSGQTGWLPQEDVELVDSRPGLAEPFAS